MALWVVVSLRMVFMDSNRCITENTQEIGDWRPMMHHAGQGMCIAVPGCALGRDRLHESMVCNA